MLYLYLKAIHIICIVCWMAGIFYFVRLLIYHEEASNKSPDIKMVLHKQFSVMEKRLWKIITLPSLVLSYLSGISMMIYNPSLLSSEWMWVKIVFVFALTYYSIRSYFVMKSIGNGSNSWTAYKLRLWNEWATVLLVAIVFTAVLKTTLDWLWGILGLVVLSLILLLAIKLYNKKR